MKTTTKTEKRADGFYWCQPNCLSKHREVNYVMFSKPRTWHGQVIYPIGNYYRNTKTFEARTELPAELIHEEF